MITLTAPSTRRLAGAIAVAIAVGASVLPTASEASPRTAASVIADDAGVALDALDRWEQTRRPVHYVRFVRARDSVAASLASELELPADTFAEEWAGLDETRHVAMFSALSQLGVPYQSLASKPGVGFDCSGLMLYAFGQAGIELPRISRDQVRAGAPIEEADLAAGDLVYYPGHISMYVGAGMMVHSRNSGSTVEVAEVSDRAGTFSDPTVLAEG
jgi:cell wall-associated NlpC family hydrolase